MNQRLKEEFIAATSRICVTLDIQQDAVSDDPDIAKRDKDFVAAVMVLENLVSRLTLVSGMQHTAEIMKATLKSPSVELANSEYCKWYAENYEYQS